MRLHPLVALLATAAAQEVFPEPPENSNYTSTCYFPADDFLEVPVRSVREEMRNAKVITFALPEGVGLGIAVSGSITMRATNAGEGGGDAVAKFYPISPHWTKGSFTLLFREDTDDDGASLWAYTTLQPGDVVGFKHVTSNIDPHVYPYDGIKTFTMIAAGVGIAPILQALYPILETDGEERLVKLIYSSPSAEDILLKPELDGLRAKYPRRFWVRYVAGAMEDDDSAIENFGWNDEVGETGLINEEKIHRLAYGPAFGTAVFVAGRDNVYHLHDSLAGSRTDPLAPNSILIKLRYSDDMVKRF